MERRNGKDESSIRPVSSLRSRFENLDKDGNPPPASPLGGRSPFLSGAPPIANRRPSTPAPEIAGLDSAAPTQTQQLAATPKRRPSLPKSRPHSMISVTPSQKDPPLVTVDSPRSPGKFKTMSVDLRQAPNLTAMTPVRTGADSPTKPFARPLSRAATPALEARMSAFLQATEAPKAQSEGAQTGPPTPDLKPTVKTSSVPPPVNRAGKPKVPTKPVTLAQKPENLTAPEAAADLSDRSISPFNTPPGSGKSSPSRERFGSNTSRAHNESDAPFVSRIRTDSDASFVERVRTDSDASSNLRGRFGSISSFAERARAGSNASFVEPSSLPESWQHSQSPPMHHHTTARREPQANGAARPARYRPVAATDRPPAGDVTDDRPRLPSRPELQMRPGRVSPPKTRSGRTSPVKELFQQRLGQAPQRAATFDGAGTPPRIPANKPPPQRSALVQGFDHIAPPPAASPAHIAPAVPAPRRSLDRRRDVSNPVPAVNGHSHDDDADAPPPDPSGAPAISLSDYPDSSNASRRPPRYKQRPYQIPTEYDTRTFAVCGEYVCTTGNHTKAWSLRTGEQLLDLEHNEIVKISSLVFKPSTSAEDDGKRIWLGTTIGEIHELDIPSQSIIKTRANAHTRKDIIRMFRFASELWTLDDSGDLNVWKPDRQGMVSLDSQYNPFRTPRGHTYSIALDAHLWIATGKEIRVFAPSANSDTDFQVLRSPLLQPGTGEIHSGATLSGKPDLVYFGHQDGKVSIYNRNDFSCTSVVNVSVYKLSSLAGVGDYLWAGFNTGMAYVYDTSVTPWRVKNDWRAHEKQICGISAERSAVWKLDRLQVVTLGTDNMLKIWDGMLEEDWLESRMQEHDSEYCSFSELTAAVLTWNAGATKPNHMQHTNEDNNFFREYLSSRDPPDIFIFGFQELVDLEDKKVTAKSFFKSKKKDANEQEHMSHQYRAWRDHLTRCLEEFMPPTQSYVLLHNASMVGLFTCVFVKSPLRNRIKHVHTAEVKRGMKGYHGNKGALVVRMVLDDSSLCFINCHLAAGQTETMHRNNDIAAILESEALPSYPLSNESIAQHADVFTSGGDGSMILDHEICILNGDLNYRIDTMGRDTVIKHINQNNLARLLERDQLLLTKRKNPGFRLRAFQESEITFAPTYKYNLQSDDYDSSEKRRAPAWCDRILYRGVGKVRMEEYRRWEVRVSDHRPVSGKLKMRVKTVDEAMRAPVWDLCQREFEVVRRRVARSVQLEYLTNVLGLSQKEAATALK
ncbi:hypothetical protein LTR37_012003 [Vermiconidia calcicola]|uniref:Uncharacterized protein n=1 Tax=Vermiconidia calcicola TaxID=1690605 RepID=A0ACC3N0J8_9PEZI|nr:hypothetical protein LTR37_012003 [Vermiconidia calcicola]